MDKLIIFDLDDTLVKTGVLYNRQINEFIVSIINDLNTINLNYDEIKNLQEEIDIQQIEKYGFSRERFPTSFVETYKFLCNKYNLPFNQDLSNKYFKIGKNVFEQIPELFDDTKFVLEKLYNNYDLVVYTLGEDEIQKNKIYKNNLDKYFKEIFVVGEKKSEHLKKICNNYDYTNCYIVGDSLKGEIEPAIKLGINAFYLKRPDSWKYHFASVDNGFITITQLKELLNYL
ncbi:MAG TPA: HAD family hydrolase [bacterium]|nr:HAD family hydrolase [bacterium]HOL46935.1 HAD family hydrolase [bacterium]HPQ18201.1 HAD family hydrolase [bacterium]